MFRQLLAFEWAYHTRQISFLFAVIFATVLGGLFATGLYSGAQVYLNAPAHLNFVFGFFSLGAIFVLMVTCANAMLRDNDSKMSELVLATAINKPTLLMSRFTGAFGAAATVMCFAVIGALVAVSMPWVDPERVGPINPFYYLWSYGAILVPSMFFSGAVIFAVAALSRSMIATYFSAVLIYILYMIVAAMSGSPMFVGGTPPSAAAFSLAAKLDPFAITTYFEQTQYWTPQQKNSDLMSFSGNLLINRLLFVALGVAVLFALHQLYRLKLPKQKQPKVKKDSTVQQTPEYRVVPICATSNVARGAWWSLLKLEVAMVVKHWPFFTMLLMYGAIVLVEIFNQLANVDFGPAYYASTGAVLNAVQFDVLPRFGAIFIVYYAAEIFWRERHAGFDAFVDCSPVSNSTLFTTKLTALLMVPLAMIVTTSFIAMGIQLFKGDSAIELSLYLSLFYYAGLPLAFICALALFLQAVSKNKYLGMILTAVMVVVASPGIAGRFGMEHPLWHFAKAPVLDFTDMNGYAFGKDAFVWYMLYWGAVSAVLITIGFALWSRGTPKPLLKRLKHISAVKTGLASAAILAMVCGGYIYQQTDFISSDDAALRQAQYERKYKAFEHLPQPRMTALNALVDFYPEQRKYRIKADYEVTNQTDKAIEQVILSANWGLIDTKIDMPAAKSVEYDAPLRVYLFDLEKPLLPGQATALNIEMSAEQSGFALTSFRNSVIDNGSHITLNSIAPFFGYRPGRELTQNMQRMEYQLPPRAEPETLQQAIERKHDDFSDELDWVDFEVTVSTAADQSVVSQGDLIGQWQEGGRNYFHYKSDGKIRNIITFLSGRYERKQVDHQGVSIEVYYHKAHGQNVDHMIEAAKHSLDYFSENFAPYPLNHLRITEVPVGVNSRMTGFASSGNMMISNYGGFTANMQSDYDVDQVYRRIAHEVAHQWWGYRLDPAFVPGSLLMVETLAKYSEMRILEQKYDAAHVRELVDYEQRRYLRGRSSQSELEKPIYAALGSENHLFYSKGGSVMYILTELLGEKTMNQALQLMLEKHAFPHDSPTSLDYIAVLKSVAPVEHHKKIDELLMQVVLYDFKILQADTLELADGRFEVKIVLDNLKLAVQEDGSVQPVDLNAPVEVAIYSAYPAGKQAQSSQLLRKVEQLQDGSQTLTYIVDKAPKYVQLDANLLYIDLKRQNNLQPVW